MRWAAGVCEIVRAMVKERDYVVERFGRGMGCRNCRSEDVRDLGFIGKVAPFFLKRVYRLEMRVPVSPRRWKEALRRVSRVGGRLFSKFYAREAYLEMQICLRCSFVQARHGFPEEWITRLYLDYRSETYNRERIQYEPSYAAIAERVGADAQEVRNRVAAATKFLEGKVEVGEDFSILDFGGADGRFLPAIEGRKFVYEISDIAPVPGVTRIATEAELGVYSYVHLAHVLEHVVEPYQLVRGVVERIAPRGYLYVEVPQEIADEELARFREGKQRIEVTIHEHINAYSIPAVTKLFEAVGLEVVAIQVDAMDVGWAKAMHLRALGRKA